MARGIGTVLLNHVIARSRQDGVRLLGEFVPTERNRMMLVTYKFSGFQEIGKSGEVLLFEHPLVGVQAFPPYVEVDLGDGEAEAAAAVPEAAMSGAV